MKTKSRKDEFYYLHLGGVGFVGVGRVVGVVTTPARNVKSFFIRTATARAFCLCYTYSKNGGYQATLKKIPIYSISR